MKMELQLGLALPIHNPAMKGFNLNDHVFESKERVAGASEPWSYGGCLETEKFFKINKRGFEEAFGKTGDDVPRTFPLMLWHGQPNEEDDRKGQNERDTYIINKKDVKEDHVVGWPPINSWRRKQLHHQHQGGQIENDRTAKRATTGVSNSFYVKVKMEGVPIARKIDLSLYHSYQSLTNTLITMFAKYQKIDKEAAVSYALTYQDNEGDRLLAGDVPWQTFIKSVQRLEIVRNGG